MKALARDLASALKASPLALALVLINIMFLTWGAYTLRAFSEAGARRDTLISQLVQRCK
jgi:hypothetical protein